MLFCTMKKVKEAYQNGFEKGYKEASTDIEAEKKRAYNAGFEHGYERGYTDFQPKYRK